MVLDSPSALFQTLSRICHELPALCYELPDKDMLLALRSLDSMTGFSAPVNEEGIADGI